ncbi:sialate O-acetylesterase [Verrucomicrobium sp. GAS474]|uniref:sialate O-acetylesterase n=1 Tax=Verrucomicrobium sp. GAS474 TaxID=1882831 RepID=UPI00087A1055|nr:sialate O-acetylesterase [Verrucomicrobium sp. GAS474]SDT98505.1 sialate O-acetylesterase [Verrucomicrobium sp. GAS474]
MKRLIPFLLLLSFSLPLRAEVSFPAILSDHAVLQKAAKVPVWGKAAPNEAVAVSIAGSEAKATADANGLWRVTFDLSAKGPGPFELAVVGADGKKAVSTDILVGEVWIASGQSNMEFILKNSTGAAEEIAASANPQLRQFAVKKNFFAAPSALSEGAWTVAGPEAAGGFTAVGYYFGKKLQKELGVPVALIHTSWGGTPVEAWISTEGFESDPEMKDGAARNRKLLEEFPARAQAYNELLAAWQTQYGRQLPLPTDPAALAAYTSATPAEGWKPVKLPGTLAAAGLPEAGAFWLTRKVTLTPEMAASRPAFDLGVVPGADKVYWNGTLLGETRFEKGGVSETRRYYLPGGMKLEAGEGIVAIRLAVPSGGAAVPSVRWGNLDLSGEWQAKVEKELPPMTAEAKAAYPPLLARPPAAWNTASYLYNAMISSVIPYAVKGAIWYQGEANVGRALQYRTALAQLIADWRGRWGVGDFPFYICQLANIGAHQPAPGESNWAELREAQAKVAAQPHNGLAVLIDCGDEDDIHPRDKKTPGERLAAIALANDYGKPIPFSGPVYAAMAVEGDAVRLTFTHAEGGLSAKPLPAEYALKSAEPDKKVPLVRNVPESQLEGFAVCGEDHVWKWADAKIEGEAVVVRSKEVAKPVAVRYAWAQDPVCNLYNGAGFPAVPFRTDTFPGVTDKNKL